MMNVRIFQIGILVKIESKWQDRKSRIIDSKSIKNADTEKLKGYDAAKNVSGIRFLTYHWQCM